jgi:hypothetical protein
VFDNSDLRRPLRKVAAFKRWNLLEKQVPLPRWLPRKR